MKKRKKFLIVALVLLLLAGCAFGVFAIVGANRLEQLSEMTFEQMLAYTTENKQDARVSVAVIQNNEVTITVYGENGVALPYAPYEYEIGSITKTFTAAMICRAAEQGELSLEEPIDTYLDLPQNACYPTVQSLLTHTSGYRSHYFEWQMVSNRLNGENDFFGIDEAQLIQKLQKIQLEDAEYAFEYSNFGYGVLGSILSDVSGIGYSEMLEQYLDELGLQSTRLSDGTGNLDNYWQWREGDGYIPAGAVISTIDDMALYVQTQLEQPTTYIAQTQNILEEIDASSAQNEKMGIYMDSIAAAWIIDEHSGFLWHNGGTGSFNSYMAFDTKQGVGVVILSNLPPDYRIPATVMGACLMRDLLKNDI